MESVRRRKEEARLRQYRNFHGIDLDDNEYQNIYNMYDTDVVEVVELNG